MTPKSRLDRLVKSVTPRPPAAGPLDIFYIEATPGEPTGVTVIWGAIGREVRYAAGTAVPLLPGGPHKRFRGPAFEV